MAAADPLDKVREAVVRFDDFAKAAKTLDEDDPFMRKLRAVTVFLATGVVQGDGMRAFLDDIGTQRPIKRDIHTYEQMYVRRMPKHHFTVAPGVWQQLFLDSRLSWRADAFGYSNVGVFQVGSTYVYPALAIFDPAHGNHIGDSGDIEDAVRHIYNTLRKAIPAKKGDAADTGPIKDMTGQYIRVTNHPSLLQMHTDTHVYQCGVLDYGRLGPTLRNLQDIVPDGAAGRVYIRERL